MAASGEVHISGLRKSYGSTVAVDDVDLVVPGGSFFCLLGPSGCGKTTLLRMIAGLVAPDSGNIEIDGVEMASLPANRRPTSIVFQDYALFPHMTVRKNTEYGLVAQKRGDKASRRQSVDETLALLGLEDLADRFPRELSGGQQQRVALARSLVIEPEVLLMDEPLSNLDAKMRVSLRVSLRELQQRLGITTIYVTHDQEEALAMADNIAVMFDGVVEQYGTPLEIYDSPVSVSVADFIGASNVVPGVCTSIEGDTVYLDILGDVVTAALSDQRLDLNTGDNVHVCIRPHAMHIIEQPRANETLSAKVEASQFTGDSVEYIVSKGSHRLAYVHDDPYSEALSGTVHFWVDPQRVRVLPIDAGYAIPEDAQAETDVLA